MKSSHEYLWRTSNGDRLLLTLSIPEGSPPDTIRLATPYGGVSAVDLVEFHDAFQEAVRVLELLAARKHLVNEVISRMSPASTAPAQPEAAPAGKESHDH
jgi:hypothetical protein